MTFSFSAAGLPLQDLIVGASVYFPPIFKAVMLGFLIWLVAHRVLRVSLGLALLIAW